MFYSCCVSPLYIIFVEAKTHLLIVKGKIIAKPQSLNVLVPEQWVRSTWQVPAT